MSKRVFKENQRFTQPMVWVAMAVAVAVVVYQYLQSSDKSEFLIPTVILLLAVFLLLSIRLKTGIDEIGIHVQMFPFHLKPVTYKWTDLYSAEVVKYSPLGDYGGWGIRISFRGKGKAFNVRGDKGIKIVTADGRTRMIGTQQEEKAREAVESFKSIP